jgi:hypothetical protein
MGRRLGDRGADLGVELPQKQTHLLEHQARGKLGELDEELGKRAWALVVLADEVHRGDLA